MEASSSSDGSNRSESLRHFITKLRCEKLQTLRMLTQREISLREWRERQERNLQKFRFRQRRVRRTRNEEVNRLVLQWYCAQKESCAYVTGPALQKEALSIAKKLGISNFTASNGWLESFRRFHNINLKSKGKATGLRIANDQAAAEVSVQVNGLPHVQVTASYLQPNNHDGSMMNKSMSRDGMLVGSEDSSGSSVQDEVPMPVLEYYSLASDDRDDSPSPVAILHTYSILDKDDDDDQFSPPPSSAQSSNGDFVTCCLPSASSRTFTLSRRESKLDASPSNDDFLNINQPSQALNQRVIHYPIPLRPPAAFSIQESQSSNTFTPVINDVNPIFQQHQQHQSVLASNQIQISTTKSKARQNTAAVLLFPAPKTEFTVGNSTLNNYQNHLNSGPFGTLATMAHSNGLSSFEYSDDRGDRWMEIRPPPAATVQIPFYGYRTHLMRLIINSHLEYWMEALGQCVGSGSFLSLTSGNLDVSEIKAVFHMLAGGVSLCQGRDSVHPSSSSDETFLFTLPDCRYRSYNCSRLVDGRTGQTQCSACSGSFIP